jgi:hypothetical protein
MLAMAVREFFSIGSQLPLMRLVRFAQVRPGNGSTSRRSDTHPARNAEC